MRKQVVSRFTTLTNHVENLLPLLFAFTIASRQLTVESASSDYLLITIPSCCSYPAAVSGVDHNLQLSPSKLVEFAGVGVGCCCEL